MDGDIPEITILETSRVRVRCARPDRSRCIVTFGHYRPKDSGFDEKKPSASFIAAGWGHLMISTAENDWYLNDDLPLLREALATFTFARRGNRALGFSMGGFAGLLLRDVLALETAVLVSPQISPFKEHPPYDTRYTAAVKHLKPDPIDLPTGPGLGEVLVLYDPRIEIDRAHVEAISKRIPGVRPCALPLAGHPASQLFSGTMQFGKFQTLMTGPVVDPAGIRQLHRQVRGLSPVYWQALADWAAPKRPALAKAALENHDRTAR